MGKPTWLQEVGDARAWSVPSADRAQVDCDDSGWKKYGGVGVVGVPAGVQIDDVDTKSSLSDQRLQSLTSMCLERERRAPDSKICPLEIQPRPAENMPHQLRTHDARNEALIYTAQAQPRQFTDTERHSHAANFTPTSLDQTLKLYTPHLYHPVTPSLPPSGSETSRRAARPSRPAPSP